MVGMTLSGPLLRLIEHHDGVRALLHRWERTCRSKHRRWPDHAQQAMCATLAWMTIRDRFSLSYAAAANGLSYARGERLLENALRAMLHWQTLDARLIAAESHDRDYCSTCRLEDVG